VIGADLVYHPLDVEPLLATLQERVRPGGVAWLMIPAPENRPDSSPVPDFVEKMRAEMDGR